MRLPEIERGDGFINRLLIRFISMVSGMRLLDGVTALVKLLKINNIHQVPPSLGALSFLGTVSKRKRFSRFG